MRYYGLRFWFMTGRVQLTGFRPKTDLDELITLCNDNNQSQKMNIAPRDGCFIVDEKEFEYWKPLLVDNDGNPLVFDAEGSPQDAL